MKAMLTKIVAMLLVVTVTAGVAITGTLAFLTDRDSEANVFTTGDVQIDLNEDFDQGSTLIPGVDIEKEPTITNTGKNDAYVWAQIAVPAALDSEDASKNVIHFNYSKDAEYNWTWTKEDQWLLEKNVEINGVKYNVYTALYDEVLKSGETTTYPVIYKVYMDDHVDIDPNGDWYHVENGVVSEKLWSETDGNPVIYVSAYAMQTEGFNNALEAYEAYNKQWTTEGNVNNGLEWGAAAAIAEVGDAAGLKDALKNEENDLVILDNDVAVPSDNMESNAYGKTGISMNNGQTLDGHGNTLSVAGANGTWDSAINTTGGTIKNLTIDKGFRGIFINHNSSYNAPVVLENVIIDGPVYTISCDQGTNQGLTATNCTFNGWTSYAATMGNAKFVDCKFGAGAGYNFSRPYAPTEYVNCNFAAGHQIDAIAAVTFENCTIDGVALTADNLATLVTSNIANATVK